MDTLDVDRLHTGLEEVAELDQVEPMAAYMKHRFEFLGVRAPAVRQVAKPFLVAAGTSTADEVITFVDQCWDQPEREFQYVAILVLRRSIANLEPRHLDDLGRFVTTKSWWDTVDSLAAWSVGPLVKANPELSTVMDDWIDSDDIWLARTAILHQLSWKADTDGDRLFRYARTRAADRQFFIRKAIGWALRQYAREEPERVRAFVDDNQDQLSGLTRREALKHLDR